MIKIIGCCILLLLIMSSCNKANPGARVNCDYLITDTLGTNDSGRIYIPSAFTPNGDGLNDIYYPHGINISEINTFTIYDANNNIVFTDSAFVPNTSAYGWQPDSVLASTTAIYYYKVQATTSGNRHIGSCGEINLLSCVPNGTSINNFHFDDQWINGAFDGSFPNGEHLVNCH
jgi:hypothetical protein